MRVQTKLWLSSVTTIAMVLVLLAMSASFVLMLQRTYAQQRFSQQVTEMFFILALQRAEYLAHGGDRPKAQWINVYEQQSRLMIEADALFDRPEERALLADVRASSAVSGRLFGELVAVTETGGSKTVIEELNNQLTVRAYDNVSRVRRLGEMTAARSRAAERLFLPAVGIFGLWAVLLAVLSYTGSHALGRSLGTLLDGMRRIGEGELDTDIRIPGHDELSGLAAAANVMTSKLRNIHRDLEMQVKARTAELEKSRAFLDAIVRHIPNMVFLKDAAELRFVHVNKAGEDLLGYRSDELIGKSDYDFFSQEEADFFIAKDREVLAGGGMVDIPEEEITTKGKAKRWLHTKKIAVLGVDGQPLYLLGISEDITLHKQIEDARAEFMPVASHQLRTPLTEIRWALSGLESEKLPREQKAVVRRAHAAAVHMADTIKAMLMVAHIDTDGIRAALDRVMLADVLDDIVRLHRGLADKKGILLRVECPADLDLLTDVQLLKEMLSNLLINACKYTGEGGRVEIAARAVEDAAVITIEDTGCGIPAEDQAKISRKFFRGSNVVRSGQEGNGLGLHIVYSLARLLGGGVSFTSRENIGTTFTLTFPRPV